MITPADEAKIRKLVPINRERLYACIAQHQDVFIRFLRSGVVRGPEEQGWFELAVLVVFGEWMLSTTAERNN